MRAERLCETPSSIVTMKPNLLTKFTKLFDSTDMRLNKPEHRDLLDSIGKNSVAFLYFQRHRGKVYECTDSTAETNLLIGCERDLAAPDKAVFRAYSFRDKEPLGWVGLNPATKVLTLLSMEDEDDGTTFNGLVYENVGSHAGNEVFARLDRTALKALHAGKNLTTAQLDAYGTSMKKGVIASGGSGSDGIKNEGADTWVIKLTISIAKAIEADNTLSPMANELRSGKSIYLNFNQLVKRH